ncbi:MAG TPA: deoxyribose-phosphate aldolase [bacterium]|nr:deoxyribose-phosphate aldolase [bacterium]
MDRDALLRTIDQTLLTAGVSTADMEAFVAKAIEYGFGHVCVLPNAVSTAYRLTAATRTGVVAVVSFPLGADVPEVKRAAAQAAFEAGADEVDMVINLTAARTADAETVVREVAAVWDATPAGAVLKTIIEVPLLTPEHAVVIARAAERGGAHMIKTSTGFKALGIRATSADDVRLLRSVLRPETGIKAAGGIASWTQAAAMLEAGATRLGTSAGVAIVDEFRASTGAAA